MFYIYIYACINASRTIHMCVYTAHKDVFQYAYIHACIHAYTHTHIHTYIHACVELWRPFKYVFRHILICMLSCTDMHASTQQQPQQQQLQLLLLLLQWFQSQWQRTEVDLGDPALKPDPQIRGRILSSAQETSSSASRKMPVARAFGLIPLVFMGLGSLGLGFRV